jgi:hypothetical protein
MTDPIPLHQAETIDPPTVEPLAVTPPEPLFAIVELFGHARIAGRVSEQTFGGASFVRVDVPEVRYTATEYERGERVQVQRVIQAHTRSFGSKAIYSVNWCDEAAARVAAQNIKHEPVQPYALRDAIEGLSRGARQDLLGFDDDDGSHD